jgi:para-nitrobenzyl esterase
VAYHFGSTEAPAILMQYPSSLESTPQWSMIRALTDHGQAVVRLILRQLAAGAGRTQPIFRYDYAHIDESGPDMKYRAGHALELRYEFHNWGPQGFTPSADELALADTMMGYWVRFAATGDPNGDGAETWPHFDAQDSLLILDVTSHAQVGLRESQCDFWDSIN